MAPATDGWGDPGRKHGDPQAVAYGRRHIVPIEISDGSRFTVRREVAPLFEGFLEEIVARGYRIAGRILDDWGWYVRPIKGTSTISRHARGLAIDVNALTNPQRRPLTTDMPAWVVAAARRWGLRWGGDYVNAKPDPMHFEFIGTRDEAIRLVERFRRELPPLAAALEEEAMRIDRRHIEIKSPDKDGLQIAVVPELAFADVFSAEIKANDNGVPTGAGVEHYEGFQGMLALSFHGLGYDWDKRRPIPAPTGTVEVVLGVRR